MSSPQHPPAQPWTAPPPRPRQQLNPEHEGGHKDDAHEHTRLALIIALSIAVVSVLGAVVGWRAELHASKASRYEQDAVATSIKADGNFDAEKYANDYTIAAREGRPLDANLFRDKAEAERHHEDNML